MQSVTILIKANSNKTLKAFTVNEKLKTNVVLNSKSNPTILQPKLLNTWPKTILEIPMTVV